MRKPHILKHKIRLAELIQSKWKPKGGVIKNIRTGSWRGVFYSEKGLHIYVKVQKHSRNVLKGKIDYVNLRFNDSEGMALSPSEVKSLLNKLDEDKSIKKEGR